MISNGTVTIVDASGGSIVVAVAAAIPASGVMVMGSDGTLSRFISTDTTGRTVVVGAAAAGAAAAGNPLLIGGTDGTNARALLTDTTGRPVMVGAGVAGTPTGGVVSIQGVTGGTALPVATATDKNGSGTLTALNSTIVATTGGCSTVTFDVTGTWVGTISIQGQAGDGNWVGVLAWSPSQVNFIGSTFANTLLIAACGGFTQVRLLMSAYTSGTASVTWNAGSGTNIIQTGVVGQVTTTGPTSPGNTPFSNPLYLAGVDGGGLLRALLTDTAGRLDVVGAAAQGAAAAGNPLLIGGSDGTNVQTLRVKPASTAAVATDPALVVAISPNNAVSIGTPADKNGSGTITALNGTVVATTGGCSTVAFDITGTWSANLLFEGQAGDGTWTGINAWSVNGASLVQGATTNQLAYVSCGGLTQVRLRASTFTSGTVAITWNSGAGLNIPQITIAGEPLVFAEGQTPVGTAPYGQPVLVGGVDGGGLTRQILTDVGGRQVIVISDGTNGPTAVKPSSTAPLITDASLVVAAGPNSWDVPDSYSSYQPDPSSVIGAPASPQVDSSGRLETHSTVLSDEGSFRDDFSGSGLTTALTGTLTFTGSSTTVTGSGTSFTTQVDQGQWIKKTADAETLYAQVASVQSDTSLTLVSAYGGTTASTTGVISNWKTVTGSGGTISVASSILSIASGTTASSLTQVVRTGDYCPYIATFYVAVSQRIANETVYFGFQNTPGSAPTSQCSVQFTGTDNTKVTFVTAFSSQATDQASTTVSLPNGGTTNNYHTYAISLSANLASLVIDGVVVATSAVHLPGPYAIMSIAMGCLNGGSAPASSTTLSVDMAYFANFDRLQVDDDFTGEPLPTQIISISPNISTSGRLPVDPGTTDVFFQNITGQRLTQIQVPFNTEAPSTLLTVTTSSTATSALGTGVGTFSTGTGTTAAVKGVTPGTVFYSPHHEIFSAWTVSYTTPTSAASYQRAGLYNATDGFSFGYNGTTFGLWLRYNSVDTFIAQTSWNVDTCSGNSASKFTNQNTPTTLVTTNINLYRVRFGWLGIAPIVFEILSPDGNFVVVHIARFPNTQTTVSVTNPNLPMTIESSKTASDATNLILTTGCWVAGITAGATPVFSGVNSITANGQSILIPTGGISALSWNITGTWSGTLTFQYSADGINWVNDVVLNTNTGAFVTSSTTNQNFETNVAANKLYRITSTAWTSGTAIVAYNAGSGTGLVTAQSIITDGLGNGPVAVKAASTLAAAADPSLVVALSPNTPFTVTDRAAMTAGTQIGMAHIGQSYGVGRIQRLNRMGAAIPGYQTLLAWDSVEGTTVNTWNWTQSTTTMTIAQTTGLLTLNNSAITTTTTDAIITSNKQFPLFNQAPVGCSFKALVVQGTNAVNEIGFGAPAGTTAIVNNGAFFRINASGTILAVTSSNGTETVSASLGTIVTTTYYLFIVWIEDGGARFIIESETGVPLVDYFAPLPLTTPGVAAAVSHIPAFARVYTTGAASVAPQTKIASFQAWQYDINTSKPWSEQLAGAGRSANIVPTTFAQAAQLAAGAAPTGTTPTNTTVAYTTLGGEYILNATASSENLLGVFGYQVPSPYTFNITDIYVPLPFVSTNLGATINIQEWCFMVASSSNPSTATGQRYTLGMFSVAASATASTVFNGQPLALKLTTPVTVLPGQYVLILVKEISGSATGAYRGSVFVNGYYE